MFTTLSLQLDANVYARLKTHLGIHGDTMSHSEAINKAIDFWLAEPGGAHPHGMRGYQWKSLFLPEGTVIESWSYGEHNYARVEGDQIMHQGRAVSPNQFAQSFARTTRNAWRDLFVRRPGDKHFTMASRLRKDLAEKAKAPAPSAQAAPATAAQAAPATPSTPSTSSIPSMPSTPVDTVSQLLAALLPQLAAIFRPPPVTPPSVAPKRDVTPEPEWDLPERRHFRYRLEDVAY